MSIAPHQDRTPEIFLYFRGRQEGPLAHRDARHLWIQSQQDPLMLYWKPGMTTWAAAAELFGPDDTPAPIPRILVVDDDVIMTEFITHLLRQEGYAVDVCIDVQPACRILDPTNIRNFDCVVTDYQMPGGSGLDLVRWIKQCDEGLQILLLTAQDDKELVKRGLRAGIYDFLEKPLQERQFFDAVRSAVNQTARRREEKAALLEMVRGRLSGNGALAEQVITSLANRESSVTSLFTKLDTIVEYSKKLEDPGQASSQTRLISTTPNRMTGTLGHLSVLDLLQLLVHSGKTGKLTIEPDYSRTTAGNAHPGGIYLHSGAICHAEAGSHTGSAALKLLLLNRGGVFEFAYDEACPHRTIHGDSISVLLTLSAEMDEETARL